MKQLLCFLFIAGLYLPGFAQSIDSMVKAPDNGSMQKPPTEVTAPKRIPVSSISYQATGIKEALMQGAEYATARLSVTDSFYKNPRAKIELYPEIKMVEKHLKAIDMGMGNILVAIVFTMNRVAEKVTYLARPVLATAIQQLKVKGEMAIINGADNAATLYLDKNVRKQITNIIRSMVFQEMKNTKDAFYFWKRLSEAYVTSTHKPLPYLPDYYITEKTLDAIFLYIADEEKEIRTNPAARKTGTLKIVFGNPESF